MNTARRHTQLSKVTAKGDRLKWTPLKEVKPVVLNADLTQGKNLDKSLEQLYTCKSTNNFFVP